jgi:hypothetical protein
MNTTDLKQPEPSNEAALERLKSNIHRRAEYYRIADYDPHQINQALYVAMLEIENAIGESLAERPAPGSSDYGESDEK